MKVLSKLFVIALFATSCASNCDYIQTTYLGTDCNVYGCYDVYEDIYECETVRYQSLINE